VQCRADESWRGRTNIWLRLETGAVDQAGTEVFTTTAKTMEAETPHIVFVGKLTSIGHPSSDGREDAPTLETFGCWIFPADHPDADALGKGRPPE
jgi:hypothetical protein